MYFRCDVTFVIRKLHISVYFMKRSIVALYFAMKRILVKVIKLMDLHIKLRETMKACVYF